MSLQAVQIQLRSKKSHLQLYIYTGVSWARELWKCMMPWSWPSWFRVGMQHGHLLESLRLLLPRIGRIVRSLLLHVYDILVITSRVKILPDNNTSYYSCPNFTPCSASIPQCLGSTICKVLLGCLTEGVTQTSRWVTVSELTAMLASVLLNEQSCFTFLSFPVCFTNEGSVYSSQLWLCYIQRKYWKEMLNVFSSVLFALLESAV